MAEPATLTIALRPPGARWSLRTRDPEALSAALPLALPRRIGETTAAGNSLAVCLGPDEWVVCAAETDRAAIEAAGIAVPHSLVDISDREVVLALTGPGAADAVLAGCPRDVERLPVGWGGRTVFDGVAVMLVRRGECAFELHVGRSFAPHVAALLETVRQEIALGL